MSGDADNDSLAGSSPASSPRPPHAFLTEAEAAASQHEPSGASDSNSEVFSGTQAPISQDTSSVGSKRPAADPDGDVTQFAGHVTRHLKLKKTQHDELMRVIMLSDREQMIYIIAHILKVYDRVEVIQPGNSVWEIPRTLWNEIESMTYAVICSSVLPTYVNEQYPQKIVMNILEALPNRGYTAETKNDKYRRGIIESRVRGRLTDRRAAIKYTLLLSLGPEMIHDLGATHLLQGKNPAAPVKLNILELIAEIAALHKSMPVQASLAVCARFAYLRRRFITYLKEEPTASFWKVVDKKLAMLRKETPDEASKRFVRALREDQKTFGVVDENDFKAADVAGSDQWMVDLAVQLKPIPSIAPFLSA